MLQRDGASKRNKSFSGIFAICNLCEPWSHRTLR
jgi:hypothetical protein